MKKLKDDTISYVANNGVISQIGMNDIRNDNYYRWNLNNILMPDGKHFWKGITDFETRERKHESKNPILSEARAGARMEAYVKLFEVL